MEKKENIFEIDPDKGNISEQLGMDFDFPTQNKVQAKEDSPFPFNEGKNMEFNNDIPQGIDDFNPYKDEDKVLI